MNVICIEETAFYELIETVIERLKPKQEFSDRWISGPEVMRLLRIKSRTTLQKLRDEGEIRYSQYRKRIILYDRTSIDEFLEKYVCETF